MPEKPLKIAMVVVDANDVSGAVRTEIPQISPVLHPAVQNLLEGLRERDDIEIEVIYGRRHPEPGESRRDGCLRYVPVPYQPLPLPGIGGSYLSRLLALLRHLYRTQPDVVHAQGVERESGLVAAICRRPSLLTLHGNFRAIAKAANAKFPNYYWINAKLETFILPRVSGVLCISRYTRDMVTPLNPLTWLLPNPADAAYFNIVHQPAGNRIVCMGMIEQRKNQILLLAACDHLVGKGIDFEVCFWGPLHPDNPYDRHFLAMIAERPWSGYMGNAAPHQIGEILSEARLLVLPSLEDNCPMVIIEAMSAGVPVVASNVGGVPDLVDHGRTGLLFEAGNERQLADSVERILADTGLASRLSAAARQEAEKRFHPEAVAAGHVEIYRSLCSSSSGKQPTSF